MYKTNRNPRQQKHSGILGSGRDVKVCSIKAVSPTGLSVSWLVNQNVGDVVQLVLVVGFGLVWFD